MDYRHPLQRNGTSQVERWLKALEPQYVKIDDRSIQDLIVFTHNYAGLLQYVNEDNKPDGDWQIFWRSEPLLVYAIISTLDTTTYEASFLELTKGYFLDRTAQNTSQQLTDADFKKIIYLIYSVAKKIEWVYDDLDDGLPLKEAIRVLINRDYKQDREQLQTALKELIGYDRGLSQELDQVNDYACFINVRWGMPHQSDFDCILPNEMVSVEMLQKLFKKFLLALQKIKSLADTYFDQEQKNNSAHQPHIALFITFLRLFDHARNSLNGLVEKQLDFYYENVLCQHRHPHVPDQVHVVFELAKEFHQHQLLKGTVLSAGKDKSNKELHYEIEDDWVFNQAKIKEIKTIQLTDFEVTDSAGVTNTVTQVTALPDAPSQDGKGKAFASTDDARFRALGDEENPRKLEGEYGFLISSPQLLLEEGLRKIMLTLETTEKFKDEKFFKKLLKNPEKLKIFSDLFTVQVSVEDNWLPVVLDRELGAKPDAAKPNNYFFVRQVNSDFNGLAFEIWLLPETPPITAPSKIKADRLAAELTNPAVKILLKNGIDHAVHKLIREATIKTITIDVDVVGVSRNLIVQNDSAVMDATKKFLPFTATPQVGSGFYLGSREVFQKKLTSLDIIIDWDGLPKENFEDYYKFYTEQNIVKLGEFDPKFIVNVDYLEGGVFTPIVETELFERTDKASIPQFKYLTSLYKNELANIDIQPAAMLAVNKKKYFLDEHFLDSRLNSIKTLNLTQSQFSIFQRQSINFLKEYIQGATPRGFVRLSLQHDFLHDKYANAVVNYANIPQKERIEKKIFAPNPPYTPTIRKIDINYSSTQEFEPNFDSFYYLTPFNGYKKESQKSEDNSSSFPALFFDYPFVSPSNADAGNLKMVNGLGNLYIGLTDINPRESISLLFQVADGSEKNFEATPPKIMWSYLAKNDRGEPNNWVDFQPYHILKNTTQGLQKSGILRLSLPDNISNGNTLLNPDLFWIRASSIDSFTVENDSGNVSWLTTIAASPDLVSVKIQAAVARFKNQDNELSHLATALPKQQIKKLKVAQLPVKKVDQPYASFEGKLPENGNEFYRRVSERLRHKDRAMTIWDYEHLVLEQFTDIFRAKCLSHTQAQPNKTIAKDILSPGDVLVAVVPQLANRNAVNRAEPRVPQGRLRDIEDFLRSRCSLFVGNELVVDATDKDCSCVKHTRPFPHVINPHYEHILVSLCVHFRSGDKEFFKFQLDDAIRQYLAPWITDERADITFGRMLYKSKILEFIENLPYVDVVGGFEVYLISDTTQPLTNEDILGDKTGDGGKNQYEVQGDSIRPTTARSILTTYSNPSKKPGDTHHQITAKDAAYEVCKCSNSKSP